MAKLAVFAAGIAVIWIMLSGLLLRRNIPAEQIFPAGRPRWLILWTWLLTTFALMGWIGFAGDMDALGLLAAAMTTLAAAKFFFMLLMYPDFHASCRAVWSDGRAVGAVMVSTALIGGLMIFVGTLL